MIIEYWFERLDAPSDERGCEELFRDLGINRPQTVIQAIADAEKFYGSCGIPPRSGEVRELATRFASWLDQLGEYSLEPRQTSDIDRLASLWRHGGIPCRSEKVEP